MRLLHLDSSARQDESVSRRLTARFAEQAIRSGAVSAVTHRDLNATLPLLSEPLLAAVSTPERDAAQAELATLPDRLIEELEAADAVVMGVPVYNFGVPAALKAWVDLVARAGRTFRYTEAGPVGLLRDRPVYLVVASGGTELDSQMDFATPYLRFFLRFLGIEDVRVIDATRLLLEGNGKVERAEQAVDAAVAELRHAGARAA